MKNKVLITGGAGFIGINAAHYFLGRRWNVTILDNLSRKGVSLNLKWLEKSYPGRFSFIKADIRRDQEVLNREVSNHDVVIHLAAQVAVTTSVADPRTDFEINTLGTFNMLEAARKAKTPPIFLYSSTNKVYGDLEDLKIVEKKTRYVLTDFPHGVTERQQLDFHSPYGCSKGAADKYVRDYARIYGIPTVVFRQSCIYGPNQFGIEDQGWLAWFAIRAILEKPVIIYGNGKQVRDVLHVNDLVNLYECAIEKIDKTKGKAYNIGGGNDNSVSLIEYFDTIHQKHNLITVKTYSDIRQGDQKVFISDNAKAKADIDWYPRVSLSSGVPSLISWVKSAMSDIKTLYL